MAKLKGHMQMDEIRDAGKGERKAYADTVTEPQGPRNEEVRHLQVSSTETPMGHVWFMVLISMCFTLGAAWLWHVDGMSDQARRNKSIDDAVILNTARITSYRDLLKEKGKDAAVASLSASSFDNYGN